jgi:hypothetical protein
LKHFVVRGECRYVISATKCHSEERSDEESAFAFHVLVQKSSANQKQMLHGVYPEIAEGFSMTQRQTPNRLSADLRPYLRNPTLVAASPRLVVNSLTFF